MGPDGTRDVSGDGRARAKSGKRRRLPVVVGIVAVVAAVSGVGFWNWHEQPSFCNSICHSPMDAYVDGYYNGESILAHAHYNADVTCLQCHPAKLDQQMEEAAVWVRGDFKTDSQGMLVHNGLSFSAEGCLNEGCHDYESIKASTEDYGGEVGVNPHYSHQFYGGGEINAVEYMSDENGFAMDCSLCHSSHGTSSLYCNTCHDFKVPEGWQDTSAKEAGNEG